MNVDRSLEGKNAFVTGSVTGIGFAVAKNLALRGCNVGLNGFATEEQVRVVTSRLVSDSDVKIEYYGFDLRDVDCIYNGLQKYSEKIGDIDILVNNAGIQHVSRVEKFPTDKWDEIIAVNLSAVFHCSKAVLPGMITNQWGRIINIASVHGLVGSVEKSAYIAAKHGVIGLTKVIALENAKHGVTCNAICPGYTDTEMIRKQIKERSLAEEKTLAQVTNEMLDDKHPTGRLIDPDEIGSLAAYLCSDQAGSITGASLAIDAGWSAH